MSGTDLRTLREEISSRIRAGDHLDVVDAELISPLPISTDAKAALWLYAYTLQAKRVQRRIVTEMLVVTAR